MRNIIIYRHQLFKSSEGFIFKQTQYLTDYHPIFVGRKVENLIQEKVDVRTLGQKKLAHVQHALLRRTHDFAKILYQDNPLLIHAHFGVEGVYALPLAQKLNVPLITTFHGFDATYTRQGLLKARKVSWLNYLLFRKKLAQHGTLFICVSDFIRNRLLQLGFPEKKLVTHYIGIDTQHILPSPYQKTEKIILHVARLVEKKGTQFLLRAFANVCKKDLDAQLVIIGDGPLRQTLYSLAVTLNIHHRVKFLGMQPAEKVIAWMQKASIFCLPSITANTGDAEGLPQVLLEAYACGIPVVVTAHGGMPEAVNVGETGFLVAEKNVVSLTEHLEILLENENLCRKMGKAARFFVEEHFNLQTQTRKLEKIYQELI